jgi:hypothetical protein
MAALRAWPDIRQTRQISERARARGCRNDEDSAQGTKVAQPGSMRFLERVATLFACRRKQLAGPPPASTSTEFAEGTDVRDYSAPALEAAPCDAWDEPTEPGWPASRVAELRRFRERIRGDEDTLPAIAPSPTTFAR